MPTKKTTNYRFTDSNNPRTEPRTTAFNWLPLYDAAAPRTHAEVVRKALTPAMARTILAFAFDRDGKLGNGRHRISAASSTKLASKRTRRKKS